ncbi:MAG: type II toxin-antitoxin system RelB/DinJ family antitoxin [Gemmatimonadaceae bacterium]|nr:type II toxin-antitoxin system RelB/DinJ family antitoxin [Gemmatimonadaceae bacterium]
MGYIPPIYQGAKMAKTAMIRARVEPKLKDLAEEVLQRLGLTPTTAITLFYTQIVAHRCFPYQLHTPNAETRRTIRDARAGRGLSKAYSVDELFEVLKAPETRPKRSKVARRKLKVPR